MRRAIVIALLAAAAIAGCGDSAEDDALAQVCDARADISTQVEELQGLTPATVTADAVRGNLDAIRVDLKTMRDAQAELSDERRAEVQAANDAFAATIRDVAATVLRSTSVEEARTDIQRSVDQLAETYRTSLATVDCG